MREAKKVEEAAGVRARAVRQAWIDRNRVCGEARQILFQLEGWLLEHSKKLDHQLLLCSRFSGGAQRIVQNGNMACLEDDPVVLAGQLIAGKSLAEIILDQQERTQLKRFHDSICFNEGGPGIVGGEGDLALYKQWDGERAAVLILRAAIKLQKRALLEKTKISMEKFSRDVAEIRSVTARDFLAALVELKCAVEPDQRLVEGLEPDEIACLRPRPFPLQILSSEAIQWLLDAVDQKMISAAELGGLQLETVKSAETVPEASERWIQEFQP